jgi:hypothetical protein
LIIDSQLSDLVLEKAAELKYLMAVQLMPASLKGPAKSALALALASLVLLLALASACEPLHQALHKHTHEDGDTCAVCMMANGLVESPECLAILPIVLLLVAYSLPVFIANFVSRSEFLLPPGRGPPAFCAAS